MLDDWNSFTPVMIKGDRTVFLMLRHSFLYMGKEALGDEEDFITGEDAVAWT